MRLSNFHFGRLAALTGFLTSAAIGCVITVGDGGKAADGESCPDANSFLNDGECFCSVGYDWCNDNDIADLSCCENDTSVSASNSNSVSASNSNSNSNSNSDATTDDQTSGTTSDIPTTSDTPTSGTTGEPLECTVEQAPPASCNPDTEPFLCIQASDPLCDTEGSKSYLCSNGVWVEDPTLPDMNCKVDGYDFGVGCEDDGTKIIYDCGYGPGTACESGTPATCNGEIEYQVCYNGKLTATDCTAYCMEVGDGMGVTYDYGFCGAQRGELACLCCDDGDEGCPINGGSTTGGTTGGGTTSGA